MTRVGFSTGDLFESELSLDEVIELYHSTEADAIEVSFGDPRVLLEHRFSEELKEMLRDFSYLSIHAPFINLKYGNNKEKEKVTAQDVKMNSRNLKQTT